jgi:hypothetical protein
MVDRFGNDDAPAAPGGPPMIGTDNTPWMTAEQIQSALNPPPDEIERALISLRGDSRGEM